MFTIEKHTVDKNAEKFAQEMIKAQGKYKYLGSGSYGTVYGAKGSNVVYKLGDASDNTGYIAFIKTLAKQKTQNPFMPKVYGVRFIKDENGDEVFVVAMERLQHLPRDKRTVVDFFCNELEDDGNDLTQGEKMLGVKRLVPKPLKEALDILRIAHRNSGSGWDSAGWDLHAGNFMMRGQQVVCTDPLA